MTFLIYGAAGYTGRLRAEHAMERWLAPVLAGRNADRLRPLAEDLGLGWRSLRARSRPRGSAGHRSRPARGWTLLGDGRADGIRAGVHYCDSTGAIDIFEALAALDARARDAGVMLLPGAGFDVVPSDCLAAHAAACLPGAVRLRLSIGGISNPSRGTVKTMLEGIGTGVRVRRDGAVVQGDPRVRGTADFGAGARTTVGVPWSDVSTAWRSTGIADIEVFFEATRQMKVMSALPPGVRRLMSRGAVLRFLQGRVDRHLPPGPSAEHRATGRAAILAEVWDASGQQVSSLLATSEPHQLTACTAVEIARLASEGSGKPGYQTPATAFGADFILGFDGVTRTDQLGL